LHPGFIFEEGMKSLSFDDCFFKPGDSPLLSYFCVIFSGVFNGDDVLFCPKAFTSVVANCDAPASPSASELLKYIPLVFESESISIFLSPLSLEFNEFLLS